MERLPYGRYTKEFRQEAVKQVVEEGLSVHEAANRLSLSPTTLSNWVKAYKAGKLGEIGKNQTRGHGVRAWCQVLTIDIMTTPLLSFPHGSSA